MPKRMILSLDRKCLFCANDKASHVKVLRVKAASLQTLICVLCDEHSQATNSQIIEMASKFPDRVKKTTISGLSRNQIEIHEKQIEIWG